MPTMEEIAPATPELVPHAVPPEAVVLQAGLAYIISACFNAAMKLNIPDLLGEDQRTPEAVGAPVRQRSVHQAPVEEQHVSGPHL